MILAAYTQLRLARPLGADRRRPWEKSVPQTGSPPPESAATSGTSAHKRPVQPRHRNPLVQAPDDHRAKRTPAHTPPRRAHTPQNTGGETANEEVNHPTTTPHRLKIKLAPWPTSSARPRPLVQGTQTPHHAAAHPIHAGTVAAGYRQHRSRCGSSGSRVRSHGPSDTVHCDISRPTVELPHSVARSPLPVPLHLGSDRTMGSITTLFRRFARRLGVDCPGMRLGLPG